MQLLLRRAAAAAGALALALGLAAAPDLVEAAQLKADQLSPGAASENSGKVNVIGKGAKCDYNFQTQSGTDDSQAVQRALDTGLTVEFPTGKSCLFGGVTMNSPSVQEFHMNGSSWAIPPGVKWGIEVSGYQPHIDGLYISGAGNASSVTTTSAPYTVSVRKARVVNGGSGGSAGTCTLTSTTAAGTQFVGTITATGASLTPGALVTITTPGAFSSNPADYQNEPVSVSGCGGLGGVTLAFDLGGPSSVAKPYLATAGSGGTPGVCTLTGTTGSGRKWVGTATLTGTGFAPGTSITTTDPGSYDVDPADLSNEPVTVTHCGSMTGVAVAFAMHDWQVVHLTSTTNGSGVFAGQRYQIRQKDGSFARGFIEAVNGLDITLSTSPDVPIDSGAPVLSTFGAVYVTNAYRPQIDDVKCNDIWGCILLDDAHADTDSQHGVNHGWTQRVSGGGRMFGVISGRGVQAHTYAHLDLWGGYSPVDTWTGNGSTVSFKFSDFLNLTRELYYVKVNGVAKVRGVDFNIDTNGLGLTFTSAPARGATIETSYFAYGGVGFEDSCLDLVYACGGNQVGTINLLQWSDDLVFNHSILPVYHSVVVDAAAFNCITYDGFAQPTTINYANFYWCAHQIKAKHGSIYNTILSGTSAPQTSSFPVSGLDGQVASVDAGANVDYPSGIKMSWGALFSRTGGVPGFFYNGDLCWGCGQTDWPQAPFEWKYPGQNSYMIFNGTNTFGFNTPGVMFVTDNAPSTTFKFQASGAGSVAVVDGQAQSQLAVNGVAKLYCDTSICRAVNQTFTLDGPTGSLQFNGAGVLALTSASALVGSSADNGTMEVQQSGANGVVKIDAAGQVQESISNAVKRSVTATATAEANQTFTWQGSTTGNTMGFNGDGVVSLSAAAAYIASNAASGTLWVQQTGANGVVKLDGAAQVQQSISGAIKSVITSTTTQEQNNSFTRTGASGAETFDGANLGFTSTNPTLSSSAGAGTILLKQTGTGGIAGIDGKNQSQMLVNGTPEFVCTAQNCSSALPITYASTHIASLPACNSGLIGSLIMVDDALFPFTGALANGGVTKVWVFCNGTSWTPADYWLLTGAGSTLGSSYMPALTGDVTTPGGSLTTTIAAGAVTGAKMAAGAAAANLGFTPAHAGANSDITALTGLTSAMTFSSTATVTAPSISWTGGTYSMSWNGADTLSFNKPFSYLTSPVASGALSLQSTGSGSSVNMNGKVADYLYVNNSLVAACTAASCSFSVPIVDPVTTVAALPACSSALKGGKEYVTDASAPAWNTALTGGGAVGVEAICNGSAWVAN